MNPTLRCEELRKCYPSQPTHALGSEAAGVDLEVNKGELFALLGPSGCGKTTTLRIIGGFVEPDTGSVLIEGQDVTRLGPYARRTNTVFQSYALFPHMRLGGNVSFGLKMEGVAKHERERRASEALEMVGLGGMERRRVTELSGGQQQRAALARAIVKRPAVLLLDEPLGALDLKLRRQMQDELVRLKRSTGTTFVHVTHDQEEACAIADRIAVMDQGRIVQVDSPLGLYRQPRTSYVAGFIDAGTIVRGAIRRDGDVIEVTHRDLVVRGPAPAWLNGSAQVAAVLPHDRLAIQLSDPTGGDRIDHAVTGQVERVVFTGSVFDVFMTVGQGTEVRAAVNLSELPSELVERIVPGAVVSVAWSPDSVLFVED